MIPSEMRTLPIVTLMIVAVGFVQILGCGRADTYRPVYYPDGGNLSVYTRGPALENLAQARQWVEDQNRQRQDPNWTYEIGKNCRPFEDTDIEVCEETVDE